MTAQSRKNPTDRVKTAEADDRPEMSDETPTDRAEALIAAHIEPHPDPIKDDIAEYRLKERGVPVWAIIGHLRFATQDDRNAVAEDYVISREAVEAAVAFYDRHRTEIDARLAENRAA